MRRMLLYATIAVATDRYRVLRIRGFSEADMIISGREVQEENAKTLSLKMPKRAIEKCTNVFSEGPHSHAVPTFFKQGTCICALSAQYPKRSVAKAV